VDTPLVSVVIPVFNGERYLAEAIDSVFDQSCSKIECIVVDDGSTDSSPDIAKEFPDVRYVRQSNAGVSAARNHGARLASGQFIGFLDADDVWLPAKVQRQLEVFERDPGLALVYSGLHVVDQELNFIGRIEAPQPARALRNTLLMERPSMAMWTALICRGAFDDIGGFDERLSTSADADLMCRLASSGRLEVLPEPLLLYRQHPRGMHLDPQQTERDRRLIFEKFFGRSWRDRSRPITRRAYANLYVSLAGRHLIAANRRQFLRCAIAAFLWRPDRVLAALGRVARPGGLQGRWGV
jgi:glycosyltransferase involved in cell wall biosynthesis